MPDPDEISSVVNPRVKRLVRLRKPRFRREAGVLIAEGRREVARALRAGLVAEELWFCPSLVPPGYVDPEVKTTIGELGGLGESDGMADGKNLATFSIRPTRATEAVFRKIAYHRDPEGLLGVFAAPQPQLTDLDLRRGRLLVAVGTEKPGNLGAMIRTAAAAGCDAVLAVGPAVDVFNPNTIRNSTGAVFALPVLVVERDADAVAWLKNRGVRVAAALAADGQSCFGADLAADPARPLAVVIGPEHAGLGPQWREAADSAVTIPALSGGLVDSLNASAAAAVLLFEMVRQSGEAAERGSGEPG